MTETLDSGNIQTPVPAAPEPSYAIEACGLTRRFGSDILAVDGVDLSVSEGEVFGLIGPDGAGKSTLIRMLATVLSPSEGDADVFGHSVTDDPSPVRGLVGYMSQSFSLYPDLSVLENMEFFARLRGVPSDEVFERIDEMLTFAGLLDFLERRAEHLSGGMKQKLSLAVTLLHKPRLLLLDEPTTGVDPVARREFWRMIARLHHQGITVLVATPYMDEAERCTRVAFMDGGRFRLVDTPDDIKASVPAEFLRSAEDRSSMEVAFAYVAEQALLEDERRRAEETAEDEESDEPAEDGAVEDGPKEDAVSEPDEEEPS